MKLEQKLAINYFSAKLNMLSIVSKRRAAETAFDLFCTPMRKSKRELSAFFLNAGQMDFEVPGYSIHGYRWEKENAKKILIVHGFESAAINFEKYISGLVNKGFEVIAFDAPAHGRSSGKMINLPAFLSVIKKIDDMHGPFYGFIAHSYGGLAVAHFLETVNHDAGTKAVLIAPATETTTTIDSFFKYLRLGNDVRKEFDNVIFERGGFWPDHYSIRRAMHSIKARILWFHDEQDELTPISDALRVKAEGHPKIQFRISKGLGHSRIYRDASVIQEVLDFF
jgi:pimeloyl-ACP methyl ester carboxylesterase